MKIFPMKTFPIVKVFNMFDTVFKSVSDREQAAVVLAALTVTPQDQVAAYRGIVNAAGTGVRGTDWRANAAASFITASSFISSELVDAVLSTESLDAIMLAKHPAIVRIALIEQHRLLSSEDLLRIVDSSHPHVLTIASVNGLLSLLPASRVDSLLGGSTVVADVLLRSDRLTVEWLCTAVAGAYMPAVGMTSPRVALAVFNSVVGRLGFETVVEVVTAAPLSYWWLPLLEQSGFTQPLLHSFFESAFQQLRHEVSVSGHPVPPPRAVLRVMLTVLSQVETAEKFPELFVDPFPADTIRSFVEQPVSQSSWPHRPFSAPSQARQEFLKQLTVLEQHVAAAVNAQPPFRLLQEVPPVSCPVERAQWVAGLGASDMVSVWQTKVLTCSDAVSFVASPHSADSNPLFAMLDMLKDESSFIQLLPELYRLLLLQIPTTVVRELLQTVAAAMPFEMQIASLRLGHLFPVVDPHLLHAWRLANPQVSFEMIPTLVSTDAPLTILEAVTSSG